MKKSGKGASSQRADFGSDLRFGGRAGPSYRLEWRRLTSEVDDRTMFDHRFETATDPVVLRSYAIRIGSLAFASEFRVIAPCGTAVLTDLEAIEDWEPREERLPDARPRSLWGEEGRISEMRGEMCHSLREATSLAADRGLLAMRQAHSIVRLAEELSRAFTSR